MKDNKLEELKNEVISILKRKEKGEVSKSLSELLDEKVTHLEKSIKGEWIEKSGYGVGAVRIWKGKKYKKVAANPSRWVRVFDKMDRGAKQSMTMLIHKAQNCKTVEELYQFCMSNHSLFQDENGVDLPIMDKLRAAIDDQKGKIESGEVNKPDKNNAEQKKYDRLLKEFKNEIATGKRNNTRELKEDVQGWKNLVAGEMSYRKEHNGENGGLSDAHIKHIQNCIKVGEEELQRRQDKKSSKKEPETKKNIETEKEKHQNRSDAMKGNQNARKWGLSDDDVEKMQIIKDKVEEKLSKENIKNMTSFDSVDSTKAEKQNIAKTTKVADGKVTIPATKDVKNEIKGLLNNLSKDVNRSQLQQVYYDGENLVATDGRTLKSVRIGEIDGIDPNSYVKIDASDKENISIEKINWSGNFPSYKRIIPENNNQKITFNNFALKDKIEDMKKDGSIDMDLGNITLKIKDGNVLLDDTVVGSAPDVSFKGAKDFMNFNYKHLVNAITGDTSIMAVSDDPSRAVSISTKVSDSIFMPVPNLSEINYANNREAKAEIDKHNADEKAKNDAAKEEKKKRSIKDDAKSEILRNKPNGVTDNDYENLIDYANQFYVNNGYDNSSSRAASQIKATVDNAINKINNKDFDFLDSLIQSDNKISRKVFQTITALPIGTNSTSAKEAWKKWVGNDAWKKHQDAENAKVQAEKDRVAAEKQAQIDADNEQYKGFLTGKTPAGAAKAKEILDKKGNFGGKIMSWQDLADKYISEGGEPNTYEYVTSGGKKKQYYSVHDSKGMGYEVPKTVYDYAVHISKNSVKKSFMNNIVLLDEYAHEDFDEDFNDYDASQPELFNSTQCKVADALDDIFGCC